MRSQIQPCGNAGISPSGKFVGLTGRKIVVDTYGGRASHGGGCLFGKDSRQVSRNLLDLLNESVDVLSRTGGQDWSLSGKMDRKIHRVFEARVAMLRALVLLQWRNASHEYADRYVWYERHINGGA